MASSYPRKKSDANLPSCSAYTGDRRRRIVNPGGSPNRLASVARREGDVALGAGTTVGSVRATLARRFGLPPGFTMRRRR